MNSLKQSQILDILSRKDKLTAAELAKEMNSNVAAVGAHLRRLEASGKAYVSEWKMGRYRVMTKCYTAGYGESIVYVGKPRSSKKSKPVKRKKIELDDLYIAPNNGWQSRIITQDPRMNHSDHIRFMNSFRPQADVAAQWLFK